MKVANNVCTHKSQNANILRHLVLYIFSVFILTLHTQVLNAQSYSWISQEDLDGRLKNSDQRVLDIAQIAYELAVLRSVGDVVVTPVDFFAATFLVESITGKNANNNVIEAIINELGPTTARDFKSAIKNEYNTGHEILIIDDNGNLEILDIENLREEFRTSNKIFDATDVTTSESMNELFEKARESKNEETEFYHDTGNTSFSNNFIGLEHFVLGLILMKDSVIGNFLVNKVPGNVKRLGSWNTKIKSKVEEMYRIIERVRGEGGGNGVLHRNSYEEYALGNGKAFSDSEDGRIEPPDFLTDMIREAKEGNYGPVYIREDLVLKLADKLESREKSVVELYSNFDGVGKRLLIQGLVKMLVDIQENGEDSDYYEKLPEQFHNIRLYEMNLNQFLGGDDNETKFVGGTSRRISKLITFVEALNGRAIIVFNDMKTVFNLGVAGSSEGSMTSQGLGDELTTYMRSKIFNEVKPLRVIAITNSNTTEAVRGNWDSLLEKIVVETPDKEELRHIAHLHIAQIIEKNPEIQERALKDIFEPVHEIIHRNPNLGHGIEAIKGMYDKIEEILEDTDESIATRNHVLTAMSKILDAPAVENCSYRTTEFNAALKTLHSDLNEHIIGREQLITKVVNKIISGTCTRVSLEDNLPKPKARSVIIFVGPSGVQKTTLVEAIANRLDIELDQMTGIEISLEKLYEIARKVEGGNAFRIVYINEVNRTRDHRIFDALESMIDGTGITDPTTGKKTTFENVFFILDANIKKAEDIAKNYGFSDTVPDTLIEALNSIADPKEHMSKITEIKQGGGSTDSNEEIKQGGGSTDSNEEIKQISVGDMMFQFSYGEFPDSDEEVIHIDRYPRGIVKLSREAKIQYNEAVKESLGNRDALMRRAKADPIPVGWLSVEAYRGIVNFIVSRKAADLHESNNGSELTIEEEATNFIANKAFNEGVSTGSGYVEELLDTLFEEINSIYHDDRFYTETPLGTFFDGKFKATIDINSDNTDVEINITPITELDGML